MLKRIWSAPILTFALLLLTATPLFAENGTGDTLARFEVKSRLGTVPVGTAPSHPSDGVSEPGDDDMPNKDGTTGSTKYEADPIVAKGQGGPWSFERFAARLRLQLMSVLRSLR